MVQKNFVRIGILLLIGLLVACQGSLTPGNTASQNDTAVVATTATTTSEEVPTAAAAAVSDTQAAAPQGDALKTFQLIQEGTEARFYIDEVLMGSDKTVIGVTSLVEGQILLDPANPGSVQLTPIRIDARDLTTDSNQRNGAIRRFVLQSNQEQYQYIIFEPTAINGLPATVELGQPFTFAVTGQLTIRDITREETFQLSVTATSETEVIGIGTTIILRDNYELTIPSVPSVANVSEEVKLEIEFVAAAS